MNTVLAEKACDFDMRTACRIGCESRLCCRKGQQRMTEIVKNSLDAPLHHEIIDFLFRKEECDCSRGSLLVAKKRNYPAINGMMPENAAGRFV